MLSAPISARAVGVADVCTKDADDAASPAGENLGDVFAVAGGVEAADHEPHDGARHGEQCYRYSGGEDYGDNLDGRASCHGLMVW